MQRTNSLIYIHIGKELVPCLIDSIFQTILINKDSVKIFVILSDELILSFNKSLSCLCLDTMHDMPYYQNIVTVIPLSILEMSLINNASKSFIDYRTMVSQLPGHMSSFRDSFWISTTCRFFYIKEFVRLFLKGHRQIFHIENDIMLYEPLKKLNFDNIAPGHIYMVKDSVNRAIPSFMVFNDLESLELLTQFITSSLRKENKFINDMEILARFPKLISLPFNPSDSGKYIFDGACIGQFLGGVDPRNIDNTNNILTVINNPSRGFVNETCDFKVTDYTVSKKIKNDKKYYTINDKEIVNLHVHSKQLYQFSSIFDTLYDDLISGDRIVEICDYVITTKGINEFHKSLNVPDSKKIFLDSPDGINLPIKVQNSKTDTHVIKYFVYTHILDVFIVILQDFKDALKEFNKNCGMKFVIYLHNSDNEFDEGHKNSFHKIKEYTGIDIIIYAQNIKCSINDSEGIKFLPIGIANAMWPHGSIETLYSLMALRYRQKKNKNLYININYKTYPFRKTILDILSENNTCVISEPKTHKEYLEDIADHYFCLCIRGNAPDTHRFWESLYLGTVPVIIDVPETNMKNFISALETTGLPFVTIKSLDELRLLNTKKYDKDFYKSMYHKLLHSKALKMEYYKY